eukprot:6455819-Amphidinium_carterae.1
MDGDEFWSDAEECETRESEVQVTQQVKRLRTDFPSHQTLTGTAAAALPAHAPVRPPHLQWVSRLEACFPHFQNVQTAWLGANGTKTLVVDSGCSGTNSPFLALEAIAIQGKESPQHVQQIQPQAFFGGGIDRTRYHILFANGMPAASNLQSKVAMESYPEFDASQKSSSGVEATTTYVKALSIPAMHRISSEPKQAAMDFMKEQNVQAEHNFTHMKMVGRGGRCCYHADGPCK